MSKIDPAQPVPDSPLWRIGLYRCTNLERLQIGEENAARETEELKELARQAGFEVIGSATFKYSKESEHGYTLAIAIGQSSLVFHGYPEWGTMTLCVETCGDYQYCCRAKDMYVNFLREYFGAAKMMDLEGPSLPLTWKA